MTKSASLVDHYVFKLLYASDEAKQYFMDTRVNLPVDEILNNTAFMEWIMKNDTEPKLRYDVIRENLKDLRDHWHPQCTQLRLLVDRLLDAQAQHQKAAAIFASFDLHLKILTAYFTPGTADTKLVSLFRTTTDRQFEEYIDEGMRFQEDATQDGLRLLWECYRDNYMSTKAVLQSVKKSSNFTTYLNLLYRLIELHRRANQTFCMNQRAAATEHANGERQRIYYEADLDNIQVQLEMAERQLVTRQAMDAAVSLETTIDERLINNMQNNGNNGLPVRSFANLGLEDHPDSYKQLSKNAKDEKKKKNNKEIAKAKTKNTAPTTTTQRMTPREMELFEVSRRIVDDWAAADAAADEAMLVIRDDADDTEEYTFDEDWLQEFY